MDNQSDTNLETRTIPSHDKFYKIGHTRWGDSQLLEVWELKSALLPIGNEKLVIELSGLRRNINADPRKFRAMILDFTLRDSHAHTLFRTQIGLGPEAFDNSNRFKLSFEFAWKIEGHPIGVNIHRLAKDFKLNGFWIGSN